MVAKLYRNNANSFAANTAKGGGHAQKAWHQLPVEEQVCTLLTAKDSPDSWHRNEVRLDDGATYWDAIKNPNSGVRAVMKEQAAYLNTLSYDNHLHMAEKAREAGDFKAECEALRLLLNDVQPIEGLFFPVDQVTGKAHGLGVSDNYAVSGLPEILTILDQVLGSEEGRKLFPNGLPFYSLATFNFGAIQIIQLKYREFDLGKKGNTNESLLTIMVSHDGSIAISMGMTIVMVVCTNTATHALNDMTGKVKSTQSYEGRVKDFLSQLLLGKQSSDTLIEALNSFGKIKATQTLENEILDHLFPVDENGSDRGIARQNNVRKSWLECLETAPGQDMLVGAQKYWGATTYFDNQIASTRATSKYDALGVEEARNFARVQRAMTGDNLKSTELFSFLAQKAA